MSPSTDGIGSTTGLSATVRVVHRSCAFRLSNSENKTLRAVRQEAATQAFLRASGQKQAR
jgi:hypothetical protein